MTVTLKSTRFCSVFGLGALSLLAVGCGVTQHSDLAKSKDDSAGSQSVRPQVIRSALTGAESCAETARTAESLDDPLTLTDTTVGQADDVDLPEEPSGSACTGTALCVGTGDVVGGRGMVWPGCGTGPDKAYQFQVDSACTLSVTMLPDVADLGLYLFSSSCLNELSSCACISDNAFGGMAETISEIQAEPGVDYYLVVDGYTQPPPATTPTEQGSYSLTITRTVGTCNFIGSCGNDSVDVGEACDDGNTESCDGCSTDCSVEETGCGDGVVCGDEECDDGNADDSDGCSATCSEIVSAPTDSGAAVEDAAVSTRDAGASGSGNGGQSNETGGAMNEADGSISTTGGSSLGNVGKGHNNGSGGSGGTAPAEEQPAAAAAGDDGGGGCASAGGRPLPSGAWLALFGLISLGAVRRRLLAE